VVPCTKVKVSSGDCGSRSWEVSGSFAGEGDTERGSYKHL
jgi:hypothetical protein